MNTHKNLCGRNLSSRSNLTSEEATKLVTRLKDGTITSGVSHRRESIEDLSVSCQKKYAPAHLSTRDTGDGVHSERSHASLTKLLHDLLVSRGVEERDKGLALLHLGLLECWRADAEDNVALRSGGGDSGSGGGVRRVGEVARLAGAALDSDSAEALFQECLDAIGCDGDTLLAGKGLLRNADRELAVRDAGRLGVGCLGASR